MTGTTPLDLPAGPLVAHLQAAHRLIESAQINHLTLTPDAVELHAYHCQQMAKWTAVRGHLPKPKWKWGDDRPEGLDFILCDTERAPIAGRDNNGHWHLWAPTDVVLEALTEALIERYTHG